MGALFACVLIAAGAVAFNKYRRGLRKRLTQQFVMKKGLSIGKTVDKTDLVSWWTLGVLGFADLFLSIYFRKEVNLGVVDWEREA